MAAERPAAEQPAAEQPADVAFILTAFGPFGGVPQNPTQARKERGPTPRRAAQPRAALRSPAAVRSPLHEAQRCAARRSIPTHARPAQTVVEALPAHLAERPLPAHAALERALTLPVDARVAHEELRALARAPPGGAGGAPPPRRVLAVHLGVNTAGARVELECRAVNEATFRRARAPFASSARPRSRGRQRVQARRLRRSAGSPTRAAGRPQRCLSTALSQAAPRTRYAQRCHCRRAASRRIAPHRAERAAAAAAGGDDRRFELCGVWARAGAAGHARASNVRLRPRRLGGGHRCRGARTGCSRPPAGH